MLLRWALGLLFIPMSMGVGPIPTNPMQLINMARLMGCRMNGKDSGIDGQLARAMLGFANPGTVQKCLMGCMIGWMYTTNQMVMWESGINLTPSLPNGLVSNAQGALQDCVYAALQSGKKCNMVSEVGTCFLATAAANMGTWVEQKFMPWMPCWKYLKKKIPVVAAVDTAIHNAGDSFIRQITGLIMPKENQRKNLPFVRNTSNQNTQPQPPPAPADKPTPAPVAQPTPAPAAQPNPPPVAQPTPVQPDVTINKPRSFLDLIFG